ncbi:unnamed protein product [Urochloa humidicola]
MLQIEEQRLTESDKLQAASALIAQAHQAQLGGTPPTTGVPGGSSSSNNTRPPSSSTASKKKKKRPISTGTPSSTARAPTPSFSSAGFSPHINPWTSVVQAWPFTPAPRSGGGGLLGARPLGTAPQAHVAGSTSSTTPLMQLDPQLLVALTNLSLQQSSSGGNWFLDTVASSHMASQSGHISSLTPT